MSALSVQLSLALRLHFRNRMAMLYSYLFPTMFLVAFWTLYRHDQVPLIRHLGELLTISALGGACFGLPTSMVGERERGVWRRYRLTPVPTASLVATTLAARYLLLLVAGLLQVILAMGLGMPLPRHPFELLIAFTAVAFAFLGVGLVIAMLADNVPAVQALGQTIFLPMLIIGGVAVPIASLPPWAERVSGFLPGRYAVQIIQSSANGEGLGGAVFSGVALAFIGAAACLAGARLFRWDQNQRFAAQPGKAWLLVAFAAWVAVGTAADVRERRRHAEAAQAAGAPVSTIVSAPEPPAGATADSGVEPAPPPMTTRAATAPSPAEPTRATEPRPDPHNARALAPASPASAAPIAPPAASTAAVREEPSPPPPAETLAPASGTPATWQAVTRVDIDRDLVFDRLPPDGGVVTPIAAFGQYPDQELTDQIARLADALLTWLPANVPDPVQRTRNLLFVAAVIDVAQMPMEPYVPEVVFDFVRQNTREDELIKVLYWIAVYPERGTIPGVQDFGAIGLRQVSPDEEELRNRAAIYGVKLLGRLTGHIR